MNKSQPEYSTPTRGSSEFHCSFAVDRVQVPHETGTPGWKWSADDMDI